MKILCGTDFSEQAVRATHVAAQWARCFGDSLDLIHVVDPPVDNVLELAEDARVLEQAVREAATERLKREAAALREYGVVVEERVLSGRPDEVLAREAKETGARLIVMGTHGRQVPWRWFLGSVAQRTLQRADRPVLVVREDRGGFAKWAAGKARLKMVVGVDMSAASDGALAWVRRLSVVGACEPTFVHAIPSFGWGSLAGTKDLVTQGLRRQIGDLLTPDASLLRIVPTGATPAEAIVETAREMGADLVVAGTHQPRGMDRVWRGSVAEEILQSAAASVLCVPTPRPERPLHASLPHLRTILVPTDLSAAGNRAIPYAYGLLHASGGTVVLLHVLGAQHPLPHLRRAETGEIAQGVAEGALGSLVPESAWMDGIATRLCILEAADPAPAILKAAEELGVDALCLAARHHAEITHALFGTVAEEVLRKSARPVLFVPEKDR